MLAGHEDARYNYKLPRSQNGHSFGYSSPVATSEAIMVNRGPSQGCITCKQRRVKCDDTKPQCKRCLRLGRECAGYEKKVFLVRFKNETGRLPVRPGDQGTCLSNRSLAKPTATTMATKAMTKPTQLASSASHDCVILTSPSLVQQDVALSFFLTYVTGVGRNLESTRGFMEFVRPVLAAEHHNSALFAAVNAVAALLWALLGHTSGSISQPTQLLSEALLRLQKAITNPDERERDATVLAALVLQAYETISALLGQHRADGRHRDGALALLLQRDGDREVSKYHGSLLGNILHSKVSLCVREKRPFPVHEFEWVQTIVIPHLPINPSSLLDVIGISVANLQYQFLQPLPLQEHRSSYELEECCQQVRALDTRLRMWQQNVPNHWHPKRIQSGKYIKSSVIMYQGTCDVYPSLQIANIWSVWRIYRLILVQIKLQLAIAIRKLASDQEHAMQEDKHIDEIMDSSRHTREYEELVDSLCHSVPFYLGNRTVPAVLSDMENSELMFPSYHDLEPTDDAFLRYLVSDCYVSRIDHDRHVIVHGALHIMSILAYLTGLFAEARNLRVTRTFRQEQKNWISEQFLRSLCLLRLKPEGSSLNTAHYDPIVETQYGDLKVSEVEAVASTMRQRLWTISVL
jgi:Fungal Zn(2)-Cys(6) binuclear cluster domain/Fungal specific transcription factor domain